MHHANFTSSLYKNISYFNKETVYTITKKQLIDGIRYHWVRSPINHLPKRFLTKEISELKSNFNQKKNPKKKKKINIKKINIKQINTKKINIKKNLISKKINTKKSSRLIKFKIKNIRTKKIRAIKFRVYKIRSKTTPEQSKFGTFVLRGAMSR